MTSGDSQDGPEKSKLSPTIPRLTEDERRRVLFDWNETGAEYPRECVHHLFERRAAETPAAAAVVSGGERVSYAELNARANQLAHHLRRRGVGAESRVGVLMRRGVGMVTALLGVLKAGGAYVPLDPEYPRERLRFMLEDAGVEVLLTLTNLSDGLDTSGAQTFHLDTDWRMLTAEPCVDPQPLALPGHPAYVIYTSGSTGAPKGVVVPHEGLMNLVAWLRRVCGLVSSDRATLTAGVAFDASVLELWPCLAAGASLHVPEEETRAMPEELLRWEARQGITVSFMTTPLAEALMAEAEPAGLALRVLQTGGDRLRSRGGATRSYELWNHYGPTECSVVATSGPVAVGVDGAPTIGRPIANTQVYVLDGLMGPLPVGAPGELYIGGAGVARGYLNRPAMTAERFVPDPFSFDGGARLYRTGDVVRWLAAGELEFVGRADNQVKVRGFRVEPGEIEFALMSHESVRDCVVLAREDEPGDVRLVAYVVTAGDASGDIMASWRAHLRERLPEYMVPSAFVTLDGLPLNANGKVDRRALPAPDFYQLTAGAYVAPRDEVEEALCEVWAEVLKVGRVGVHDNFFESGGHSLKATQIVSRLRRDMQVTLTVRSLFAAPTVAEFAPLVERALLEELELLSEEEAECLASE
jgi:amino acid adenylation domain-containing protein